MHLPDLTDLSWDTGRMKRTNTVELIEYDSALINAERSTGALPANERPREDDDRRDGEIEGRRRHSSLEIDVRNVRISDLPSLIRPPAFLALDQPKLSLSGYSPLKGAFSVLKPGRRRPRMFVACVDDRLIGFTQFQPGGPDLRWTAVAVGSAMGVYDAGPLASELLRFGVTAAGLRGVKRIYAKVPSGTSAVQAFVSAGFSAYATETVFVLNGLSPGRTGRLARVQQNADAWAVHQLYNGSAPRKVQYAEAVTSHRWDLGAEDGVRRRAWILDDGNLLAAYAGATVCQSRAVVEIMYSPGQASSLSAFLDDVLVGLRGWAGVERVYCALRGYQAEAATVLERRGFHPLVEQDLLVKYTTALARAPQTESLPFHAEIIERLPKRAPSFPFTPLPPPRDESTC